MLNITCFTEQTHTCNVLRAKKQHQKISGDLVDVGNKPSLCKARFPVVEKRS